MCHELVAAIADELYGGRAQFVYDKLLPFIVRSKDFDRDLQVFELAEASLKRLDLNHVNR